MEYSCTLYDMHYFNQLFQVQPVLFYASGAGGLQRVFLPFLVRVACVSLH